MSGDAAMSSRASVVEGLMVSGLAVVSKDHGVVTV